MEWVNCWEEELLEAFMKSLTLEEAILLILTIILIHLIHQVQENMLLK